MRFGWLGLALAAGTLMAAPSLHAQAPAGAPAGANGICKDGTYSMAPKKEGACSGHKGVQTWYLAATGTPAAPPPAASKSAPAMPTPKPASAAAPAMPPPVPATRPAPSAPATAKGPAASAAAKTAAPGGRPGLVWVNTESNVYHCYGADYYGKTKAGAYMTEADAKAKGARGARGQSCAGK